MQSFFNILSFITINISFVFHLKVIIYSFIYFNYVVFFFFCTFLKN